MTTTINGKEYTITKTLSEMIPYTLTPTNGRGKTLGLVRNEKNPQMLFTVADNSLSVRNEWVHEQEDGTIKQVS
jgi:hypothetical protein